MKRFLLALIVLMQYSSSVFAGIPISSLKGAGYSLFRHPDGVKDLFGELMNFAIDLIVACILVLIIAGIISTILKSILNLGKDETIKTFLYSGAFLLGLWFLLYVFIW